MGKTGEIGIAGDRYSGNGRGCRNPTFYIIYTCHLRVIVWKLVLIPWRLSRETVIILFYAKELGVSVFYRTLDSVLLITHCFMISNILRNLVVLVVDTSGITLIFVLIRTLCLICMVERILICRKLSKLDLYNICILQLN